MKERKKLERADQILTETDMQELVIPVDKLPTASVEYKNYKYMLTQYQEGYELNMTYVCELVNDAYTWVKINYESASDKLDAPVNLWANCKRNTVTKQATVYIHWDDPDDTDTATWAYTVIIKKKGSAPTSIYDGEIVGFSSKRDQYSGKTGFVDTIDIDTVDDSDITDASNIVVDDTQRYWYRVFAVTTYGVATGSENSCTAMLTWKKFQELLRNGIADHALEIGDIVSIAHSGLGKTLDFQLVDYDHANVNKASDGRTTLTHNATFMAYDVIFRGSFDHRENLYYPTSDTVWKSDKKYYDESGNLITDTVKAEYSTPIAYNTLSGKTACEKNPCEDAATYGNNKWELSNARFWLNSSESNPNNWYPSEWYAKNHMWDVYSDDVDNDGSFGVPAIASAGTKKTLFPGFLYGLDSELLAVLADVNVFTSNPRWNWTTGQTEPDLVQTVDKIFLPSYIELFGTKASMPDDINSNEGTQFSIYSQNLTNTRMKVVISDFNTTDDSVKRRSEDDNLASIWTRSPVYMKQTDPGTNGTSSDNIHLVEIVTCDHRQFDNIRDLGEDGATGRQAYMTANVSGSSNTDIPRDTRNNFFIPTRSTKRYYNNTAPGFTPCFVIA